LFYPPDSLGLYAWNSVLLTGQAEQSLTAAGLLNWLS